MLAMKRKRNEAVILEIPPSDKPTRVEVHVVSTGPGTARIAFEAPDVVRIERAELVGPPLRKAG